jgi:hypothetical protein
MLRHLFAAALALVLALGFSIVASATDWVRFEKNIKKQFNSPAFVEQVLDQYGFRGAVRITMAQHLREMYRSDLVIKAIVDEIKNLGFVGGGSSADFSEFNFRRFGSEVFQAWSIKGLARLPVEDQRQFYRLLVKLMSLMTPQDCKLLLTSDGKSASEVGQIEVRYYEKFPKVDFENYLALVRKAVYSELRDFPASKTLNQTQLETADKAFQSKFEEIIKEDNVDLGTIVAITDLASANPQEACEGGKLVINTVLRMKGLPSEWMLLKMIQSSL